MESDKDFELWKQWKKTQTMYDLENLMRQVNPLLQNEIQKWTTLVPKSVLDNTAKKIALKAFQEFDPNRKIKLSTYLVSNLQKLSRTAYERQQTVSVPEQHRLTFNKYITARQMLENELGYTPTIEHIADHLRIPVTKLNFIISNVGKRELIESGEGPVFGKDVDDGLVIEMAYRQMTPRQQQIFDYRTGSHHVLQAKNDKEIMDRVGIQQGILSYELKKIKELLLKAKSL